MLSLIADMEAGVSVEKVLELVHNAVEHVQDGEDQSAPDWIRASLQQLQKSVSALALALQDAEYDTEPRREDKAVAPIILRAQQVKKELEETKMLKQKLETRETDIKVNWISLSFVDN